MAKKDITNMFEMRDLVSITLKSPLYPHCMGSETHLSAHEGNTPAISTVMGQYVGSRPGIIKIRPIDGRLLDSPPDISRYLIIPESEIKEVYKYREPVKVFP